MIEDTKKPVPLNTISHVPRGKERTSSSQLNRMLPTDILDSIAQWLSHAEARSVQACCRVLRDYWEDVGLHVHPWCRTIPWCRGYFCRNRMIVAGVEPFIAQGDSGVRTCWKITTSLLQLPVFMVASLVVLPICTIVLHWSGDKRMIESYWKKETSLLMPFGCDCLEVLLARGMLYQYS